MPAIPTPTPTPTVTVIVEAPVVSADVLPSDLATTGVDLRVGWFALVLLALGALGLAARASGHRAAGPKSR